MRRGESEAESKNQLLNMLKEAREKDRLRMAKYRLYS